MNRLRATAALVLTLALALAGCGDPLDSRYGVTNPGSINGCAVLHDVLKARTSLRDAEVIGPRLEQDGELLIHLARYDQLPNAEACTWLEGWLQDREGRQAVLILRSGNLTGWLCRRWADQARAEARRGGTGAAKLDALAQQLERRAAAEDEDEGPPSDATCPLFAVKRHVPRTPISIEGLELTQVPQAMRVTGSFQIGDWPTPLETAHPKGKQMDRKQARRAGSSDDRADRGEGTETDEDEEVPTRRHGTQGPVVEPLITLGTTASTGADRVEGTTGKVAWAITIPYGDSRLIVVLDALPLLDGAQPDPAARRLLEALVDHITDFHDESPHATWVRHLRVRGEGGPPNPMLAVLTSPPVAYISWHFVAFLVVLALAGAAWLGRREAPAETRHDRFSRHVLALAERLRDGRHAAWCARAIARAALRHRQPPPALLTDDEARRWLISLTDNPTHPPAPTASPRGPHDHPDSSDA
jgi:hypothetical protein